MAQSLAAADMKITIVKDGPYQVTGGVPLERETIGANECRRRLGRLGRAQAPRAPRRAYQLCRCGHSRSKPLCDGSHQTVGFDGTETASRVAYDQQAGVMEGPALALTDAETLCAFARFCDRDGNVWNTVSEVSSAPAQEGLCAPGRPMPVWAPGRDRQLADWRGHRTPTALPSPWSPIRRRASASPIWVRGGIEVVGSDGVAYEVRNRVTLCRCGASRNKPFCDGGHASEEVRFQES